jgi:hypothetical protein
MMIRGLRLNPHDQPASRRPIPARLADIGELKRKPLQDSNNFD